jgi:hypothetical protein
MKFANATNLNRKSGGAQWRDLRFLFRFSGRPLSPPPSPPDQLATEAVGASVPCYPPPAGNRAF